MRRPERLPQRARLLPWLIPVLALVLAGCGNLPYSTTTTYGDHARRIYELMVPVFWMALGVFVVVEGMLLYTILRFRRSRSQGMPAQVHGNTQIEIMWTIAPALIVLVVAVLTFRTQAANSQIPNDAMQIRAVGHQWWFEFRYPRQGVEGDDLVTASDMYIPVGRPVAVTLEAVDVMHNFWVPKLAGKTYMIPGKTNFITFTAEQPGIYRAVCAEFCGEAHALMRFRVIAVPAAEFDKWVAQKNIVPPEPVAAAAGGDPVRGQAIFLDAKKQCISCHAVSGTNARGVVGPNLTYYGNRLTIAAGVLKYSPENLALWLKEGYRIKPGNLMSRVLTPNWIAQNLNDQEIADLVAYLDSMKLADPVALPPER